VYTVSFESFVEGEEVPGIPDKGSVMFDVLLVGDTFWFMTLKGCDRVEEIDPAEWGEGTSS